MMKDSKIINLEQYRQLKELEDDYFYDDFFEMSNDDLEHFKDDFILDGNELKTTENLDGFLDIKELEKISKQYDLLIEKKVIDLNKDSADYFFSKVNLALLYRQNGLYQKSLEIFEMLYQFDESDTFGCRYEILALYVLMSDYASAVRFFRDCQGYESDILLQVPLLVAAILAGDDDMTHYLIEILCVEVSEFAVFCQIPELPIQDIIDAGLSGVYKPNSLENVYLGFYRVLPLLTTAGEYVKAYLNDYFIDNDEVSDDLEELAFLSSSQLAILSLNDIYEMQDFQVWTEDEILALPKFGKATLEKLKEAGVIFSQ